MSQSFAHKKQESLTEFKHRKVKNESIYSKKHIIASSLILILATFFYSSVLNDSPFFTRGESREALVVEAMTSTHNSVLPIIKSGHISTKPPMFHWLGVLSEAFFTRSNEFSIRFPSALSSGIALSFFFLLVSIESNLLIATLATLILASSFEWLRAGIHARVDMCLALGITLSISGLYKLTEEWRLNKRLNYLWFFISILGTIVAILSKGPMGLLIPLAIIGLYWISENGITKWLKEQPFVSTSMVFFISAIISGIWYYLAYQQQPDEFYRVHWVNENLARFIDVPNFDPGHKSPFYVGFLYLISSFLPWSLFFPVLCIWLWKTILNDWSEQRFIRLCIIWAGVIAIMVIAATAKRSVYLLPASPPIALLLAFSIRDLATNAKDYIRSYTLSVSFLYVVAGIVTLATALLLLITHSEYLASFIRDYINNNSRHPEKELFILELINKAHFTFQLLPILVLSLLTTSIIFLQKKKILGLTLSLASSILISALVIGNTLIYQYSLVASPKSFMAKVNTLIKQTDHIYQFKDSYFAATYYGTHNIPSVSNLENLLTDSTYFLVDNRRVDEFLNKAPNSKLILEGHSFSANQKYKLMLYKVDQKA